MYAESGSVRKFLVAARGSSNKLKTKDNHMQQKIMALAVASVLTGAAFAQSNVTIYGVADVSAIHAAADGKRVRLGIESGSRDRSRTGFSGEEALGNGIKAVFKLEYGLAADNNNSVYAVTPKAGDAAANDERVAGLGLNYSVGAMSLQYSHQRTNDLSGAGFAANTSLRDNAFAVSYDFGIAKVLGVLIDSKRDGTASDHQLRQWNVGALVPLSPASVLRVQFASLNDRDIPNANADARSFTLGYDLNLSKRTMAYVDYNRTSNEAGAQFSANGDIAPPKAGNASLYGIGLRHSF